MMKISRRPVPGYPRRPVSDTVDVDTGLTEADLVGRALTGYDGADWRAAGPAPARSRLPLHPLEGPADLRGGRYDRNVQ